MGDVIANIAAVIAKSPSFYFGSFSIFKPRDWPGFRKVELNFLGFLMMW